jgi:capsular polysaccharide biosynthesis protein
VDLRTLLRILFRRWIVVVPTIIVAVLVAQQVLSNVKPEYEAKGSLLLLAPTAPANAAAGDAPEAAQNPYVDLRPALRNAGTAFATLMLDSNQKKALVAQGLSDDYEITVDDDAPILEFAATSDRRRIAIETVQQLLEATQEQIGARENARKVAIDDRIGVDVLQTPTTATTVNAAKTRALIALIALGVAATLSVALLVESWSQSPARRDRRRRRDGDLDDDVIVPVGQRPAAAGGRARASAVYSGGVNSAADDDAGTAKPARAGRARAKPRGRSAAQ